MEKTVRQQNELEKAPIKCQAFKKHNGHNTSRVHLPGSPSFGLSRVSVPSWWISFKLHHYSISENERADPRKKFHSWPSLGVEFAAKREMSAVSVGSGSFALWVVPGLFQPHPRISLNKREERRTLELLFGAGHTKGQLS